MLTAAHRMRGSGGGECEWVCVVNGSVHHALCMVCIDAGECSGVRVGSSMTCRKKDNGYGRIVSVGSVAPDARCALGGEHTNANHDATMCTLGHFPPSVPAYRFPEYES